MEQIKSIIKEELNDTMENIMSQIESIRLCDEEIKSKSNNSVYLDKHKKLTILSLNTYYIEKSYSNILEIEYYKYDKVHNDNGPAYKLYINDKLKCEEYYHLGALHRVNGPASIEYYSNNVVEYEAYYQKDKLHRENGPAKIEYYPNGKVMYKSYYLNGRRHREDGPARIEYDKKGKRIYESYYVNGKKMITN